MRSFGVLGLVAIVTGPGAPLAAADEFDAEAVYKKALPSCVFLVGRMKDRDAEGLGALIDRDQRLVLTCAHLVDGAESVTAQFPIRQKDGSFELARKKYQERVASGDAIPCKVLHRDKARDLALVQLEKVPADAPALVLPEDTARVGTRLVRINEPRWYADTFILLTGEVRESRVLAAGRGAGADRPKLRTLILMPPVGWGPGRGPVVDGSGALVAFLTCTDFDLLAHIAPAVDATEIRAFLTANKVKLLQPKASDKK